MAVIKVALVTLPWGSDLLDALKSALVPAEVICLHRFDTPGIARALRRADAAFLPGDLDKRFFSAPNLRWVHCGHAGLDRSAAPEVFARGLTVTSAAGRSAPALAEHAIFFMLALSFRYGQFYDAQRLHRWGVRGQNRLRALYGQTLGIVGLGHTGMELASRAKAFGMRVIAYRRRQDQPPFVDRVYSSDSGDSLNTLLQESDYIVLAVPLSDSTYHLIGETEFKSMRPTTHLINIARGGLVNERALLRALRTGRIAGAAIDVTEEEPLPPKSPLWDAPNLLITPHVTPQLADREVRALNILLENIRRYRNDEPLLNQLKPADQFTRHDVVAPHRISHGNLKGRLRRLVRRLTHRWRIR